MPENGIDALLAGLTGGDANLALVVQVFMVVFGVVLANYVLRRILARLELRSRQTTTPWDNALVSAARRPLTVLAWIIGLSFAIGMVYEQTAAPIFAVAEPARTVGVIGCIAWFLVLFIRNA